MGKMLFTSESFTEGHQDKVCDQISDSILDACMFQDPASCISVDCMINTGVVLVAGNISTRGYLDIPSIARNVLKRVGYTKSSFGIDCETCAVLVHILESHFSLCNHEQGPTDQGIVFGYATNETNNLMPLPINLSHQLCMRLSEVRRNNVIPYLGPDGKSQVTVEYIDGKPQHVTSVLISNQHEDGHSHYEIESDIIKNVIRPVCKDWLTDNTNFFVNPTGQFIVGGPLGDVGLTGRQQIIDTYGGICRHVGSSLSGKDPSKIERSGAYMARYISKNIVSSGLADRFEIQIAYAPFVSEPLSICVNTLLKLIRKVFPFKPADVITQLKLLKPIYEQTACYGHFGRDFPWERLDKVFDLKQLAEK
jgi:S-adenosylmethionine synthetase